MFHEFQTPLKSIPNHYYLIFPLIWDNRVKMPALSQNWKFRTVFYTWLTSHSRRNMQNFQQQLQTALSQTQKIFSAILLLLSIYIKFRTFLMKKCESPSFSISQSIDSERGGYLNVQSALLQNTFRQSTCSGVPNTVEISTTSLLSYCSMNMR